MPADRKGFTIIELIVVSVLGAFVLGAIFQVLITNQRTYTAQSAVIQGQQSARMSLELLFNELRELNPSGGDILGMSQDTLVVRLPRKFGIACETNDASGFLAALLGTPTLKVLNHSGEQFEAGDSVFVFAENYEGTPNDDTWIGLLEIAAVDPTETCLSGRPATLIEFATADTALFNADTVRIGATVRGYVTYSFRVTELAGERYLGRSENGGFMWPLAGPLRRTNGLQFVYRDAMGAITNTPTDVSQIEVIVRTGTGVANSLGRQVQDSITAWIHTRN